MNVNSPDKYIDFFPVKLNIIYKTGLLLFAVLLRAQSFELVDYLHILFVDKDIRTESFAGSSLYGYLGNCSNVGNRAGRLYELRELRVIGLEAVDKGKVLYSVNWIHVFTSYQE